MLKKFLTILLTAACLCIAGQAQAAPAAAAKPNIVIVFVDDMGYGDIGVFGAKGYTTPNIDRLAHEGMRFTDAHAPGPLCHPSRSR